MCLILTKEHKSISTLNFKAEPQNFLTKHKMAPSNWIAYALHSYAYVLVYIRCNQTLQQQIYTQIMLKIHSSCKCSETKHKIEAKTKIKQNYKKREIKSQSKQTDIHAAGRTFKRTPKDIQHLWAADKGSE